MSEPVHPYEQLNPDTILDAIESAGFQPDGRMLALNSYENRVYQIGIEDEAPLVAKFYRPGRWSDACIGEEHSFSLSLAEAEIPVVPPLRDTEGRTLHHFQGFRFSLFRRQGGRSPDLDVPDNLEWIGRFLGRIHQLGAARTFKHRPSISVQTMGRDAAAYLLTHEFIPLELAHRYRALSEELLRTVDVAFAAVGEIRTLRLHGDCHPGNILWTDQGPHFVDLDDCCTGPAIQDLWMMLSGDRQERALQLSYLREGYDTFIPLDTRQVALIEPLRTLRIMHYAAWLARRWDDPAFPAAFPWFNTPQYWQDHLTQLEHQRNELEQAPLPLF